MSNKIKSYIKKTAGDKLTGREGASSRIMAMKLFRKFKIKRTAPTVNKWLNTVIGKPKKGRRTFLLREKDRIKSMKFCSKIEEKKIKAKHIFFTDEKKFVVEKHLNPQTNQIRLTARGLKELKEGDGEI